MTDKRLQTIVRKIDLRLARQGAFIEDELCIDAIDLPSTSGNKHNPDLGAEHSDKSDKEMFQGYWVVSVTGTKSEMFCTVRVTPATIHQSLTT